MCNERWYDSILLEKYSKDEIDELDKVINHNLDLKFSYVATKQFEGKYLIKIELQKSLGKPANGIMCIALAIFQDFSKNKQERIELIKEFYTNLAEQNISLPTPNVF